MSDTHHQTLDRSLRILTLDNGGLQAISILMILKDVCKAISDAEGRSTEMAPWEIFDVIAGVGTGGWLAILLGRYKFSIRRCISVYLMILRAFRRNRKHPEYVQELAKSVALNKGQFMDKIDYIIDRHCLGQYMFDEHESNCSQATGRTCYSFATGPVWRSSSIEPQEYRIFRSYPPAPRSTLDGPDPTKLKVSEACAATAAAQHFMQACEIDGTRYWDDSFPITHAISKLALTEAASLFGVEVPISLLLNISPGIPTKFQIKSLLTGAKRNTATLARLKGTIGGLLDVVSLSETKTHRGSGSRLWRNMWPPERQSYPLLRSESSLSTGSTSSKASQKEREQQEDIREVLIKSHRSGDVYMRLQAKPTDNIPYLNDGEEVSQAVGVAEACSKENEMILKRIAAICSNGTAGLTPPTAAASEVQHTSSQASCTSRTLVLATGVGGDHLNGSSTAPKATTPTSSVTIGIC